MTTFNDNTLASLLREEFTLRLVEPNIFSVLADDETGNEYDSQFGLLYDLIACHPIYNRLIWGYSVNIFKKIIHDALQSSSEGYLLDLGCGSLAFTAQAYAQGNNRPVVLADRSLKMLRMAKSRLLKLRGNIPENIVFLHADALNLPFQENTFTTIISENLLHCLHETMPLLNQLESIIAKNGKLYFTTLVKTDRWADRYLQVLADSNKLVSRTANDHKEIFTKAGFNATYQTTGNLLSIICEK
ncbi:class I SAM-dependent methyltransferase [Desulfogranum japonicum]|uniref:class I SAM-dependent methyltransferase n=1 Tax=Desulfogranum japonicum TaxID=231447 RepID=UPI000411B460|nr:class I SAM-dependent methyltransferase [Desulfogranum japonicum]